MRGCGGHPQFPKGNKEGRKNWPPFLWRGQISRRRKRKVRKFHFHLRWKQGRLGVGWGKQRTGRNTEVPNVAVLSLLFNLKGGKGDAFLGGNDRGRMDLCVTPKKSRRRKKLRRFHHPEKQGRKIKPSGKGAAKKNLGRGKAVLFLLHVLGLWEKGKKRKLRESIRKCYKKKVPKMPRKKGKKTSGQGVDDSTLARGGGKGENGTKQNRKGCGFTGKKQTRKERCGPAFNPKGKA